MVQFDAASVAMPNRLTGATRVRVREWWHSISVFWRDPPPLELPSVWATIMEVEEAVDRGVDGWGMVWAFDRTSR